MLAFGIEGSRLIPTTHGSTSEDLPSHGVHIFLPGFFRRTSAMLNRRFVSSTEGVFNLVVLLHRTTESLYERSPIIHDEFAQLEDHNQAPDRCSRNTGFCNRIRLCPSRNQYGATHKQDMCLSFYQRNVSISTCPPMSCLSSPFYASQPGLGWGIRAVQFILVESSTLVELSTERRTEGDALHIWLTPASMHCRHRPLPITSHQGFPIEKKF